MPIRPPGNTLRYTWLVGGLRLFLERILPWAVDSAPRALELMMLCRAAYLYSRTWHFWEPYVESVMARRRSYWGNQDLAFARVVQAVYQLRPQAVLRLYPFVWPTEDGEGLPSPLVRLPYDTGALGPFVGALEFHGEPRHHPDVCIVRSKIEFERDEFPADFPDSKPVASADERLYAFGETEYQGSSFRRCAPFRFGR